jgi:hypothetical protein
VVGDHPVGVQSQELDHVAHVGLALDRPRPEARPAGEDGVIVDPGLVEQLPPDVLGEAEVGDTIAVEVAPGDRAARLGPGARYWIGDRRPA